MLELGEISSQEHRDLGKFLARLPLSKVILHWPQSKFTYEAAKEAFISDKALVYLQDKESLLHEVESSISPGSAVFFKASRGMRFDETAKKVIEHLR